MNEGINRFGENGVDAAKKEMTQLHMRDCFTPKSVAEMSREERKKVQIALMLLTEKRNKKIKGRMVFNGKPTRQWLSKENSASPTTMLESLMLTLVIDAKEDRDVMTADVPNAFIQAELPKGDGHKRVFMWIC